MCSKNYTVWLLLKYYPINMSSFKVGCHAFGQFISMFLDYNALKMDF